MRKLLTVIEKLDGNHPGLAFHVKDWFDRGRTSPEVQTLLREHYGISVNDSAVEYYRAHRWAPQKDKSEAEIQTFEVLFKKFGGNYGLDLAAFARVRELLSKSDIKEANSIRLAVLKIRAQDLKEDEFKFKTGQLKPGQPSDDGEEDPAAEEAKTKRVMNKIRAIFGLRPMPDEASTEEPEAASQAMPDASPSVDEGVKPAEEGPLSAVPAGRGTAPPTPRDTKEVTGNEGTVVL